MYRPVVVQGLLRDPEEAISHHGYRMDPVASDLCCGHEIQNLKVCWENSEEIQEMVVV